MLRLQYEPSAEKSIIIAAFAGWPDAGAVATYSVSYLRRVLDAKDIGEIEPWGYYNLTQLRPVVSIRKGLIEDYRPVENRILLARPNDKALILLLGMEPQVNWHGYADAFLDLISKTRGRMAILLGGVLDGVPHTREAPVSCVTPSETGLALCEAAGAIANNYSGPSSFHTFLLRRLEDAGLLSLSLWGHAPYYADPPIVSAAYKVLTVLSKVIEVQIPMEQARVEMEVQLRSLDEKIRGDPRLAAEIFRMEADYDATTRRPPYAA